jgi:hypothetical protein
LVDLEDMFAINKVINLYGHIIDRQAFSDLDQIFTFDAVFDLSGFQAGPVYRGLDDIVAMMQTSTQHPVAHHATNILINPPYAKPRGTHEILVESKGIGVGRNGRVGSVIYKDLLTKIKEPLIPGQWRIQHRAVQHLDEPGSQT